MNAPSTPRPPALIYVSSRRYLYLGQTQLRIRELHAASSSLLVCLKGLVRFRTVDDEPWSSARSILIRAGSRIAIDNRDAVIAACYLDAGQNDYPLLKRQMGSARHGIYYRHGQEQALIDGLLELREERPGFDQAQARVAALLRQGTDGPAPGLDPRLAQVIERLRHTASVNLPVRTLAAEVGLSESGLIRLFGQHIGAPLRRHRLWYRLIDFVQLTLAGTPSAQALRACGFTDAAHLSRCYSGFFGVSLAYAFSKRTAVEYVCEGRPSPCRQG